jgi:hypothetical protein
MSAERGWIGDPPPSVASALEGWIGPQWRSQRSSALGVRMLTLPASRHGTDIGIDDRRNRGRRGTPAVGPGVEQELNSATT